MSEIPITVENNVSTFDFSASSGIPGVANQYWVDDRKISSAFGLNLSPRMADLVDISIAVYSADRRVRRIRDRILRTGSRCFHIRLAVRDIEFWNDKHVIRTLSDTLTWFTDDSWTFEFVTRKETPRPSETDYYLFPSPVTKLITTCLFSGGLDSLAGLMSELEAHSDGSFILVSGRTNDRLAHIQASLAHTLRQLYPHIEFRTVSVPYGIAKPNNTSVEKSERTRGFVHLNIGAVTAMTAQSDRLVVYENGVGAINLPQNESQIGVDNSRGVHPVSLSRMSEFLSLVNGRLFDLINPFEFQTKGEMCRIFLKTDNSDVVSKTISCDHFPIHVAGKSQCGICTSCLLRRMALHSAGLAGSDPSCKYKDDFKHSKPDKPEKLFDLQDMLAQAEKIHACVNSASPWARLSAEFPELLETHLVQAKHLGTDRSKIASKLVRMYKAYAEEWRNIPIAELDSN